MKIVSDICSKSAPYIKGQTIKPAGLMLHSVACPQPKASVFIKQWNNSDYTAGMPHAIIDANDGIIHQTLPWTMRAWHCGSGKKGSGNDTYIGVEMAEPADIKYTGPTSFTVKDGKLDAARQAAQRTYGSAVCLFAQLCHDFNLNPYGDGIIISHAEGYSRGIASNHADPRHLWRGLGLNYTMDTFRDAVQKEYASIVMLQPMPYIYRVRRRWVDVGSQVGAFSDYANAVICADRYGYRVYNPNGTIVYPKANFLVFVNSASVAIRTGPGESFSKLGMTGKGAFTIVDTQKDATRTYNWGLLKSCEAKRNGWINLNLQSVDFKRDLLK